MSSQEKASPAETPRLLERYRQEVVPALMEKFKLENRLQAPRLTKVVINMGIGAGAQDIKVIEQAAQELGVITGQRPVLTRAKKAISNFKIRQGQPVGVKVTLRRALMYEFLDRLLNVAMPRMRDFRGVSLDGFDGGGNYALGLTEQLIFPEIDYDKVNRVQGMDVVICTTAKSKEEALELLKSLGMPFKQYTRDGKEKSD